MGRWYFVRHGQSVANRDGWLAGHFDAPLTDHGIEQARSLQPQLQALTVGQAFSSDLVRAQETARLALKGTTLTPTPLAVLRERDLGAWEGLDVAQLREQGTMDVLLQWDGRPPGGESQRQVAQRVLTWMVAQDTATPIALFIHGGIIRAITGLLDDLPLADIGKRKIKNAVVIERTISNDRLEELLSHPDIRGKDATDSTPE